RGDRHPVAALQAALQEAAGDRGGEPAQIAVGVLPLAAGAEIEQRHAVGWRLARQRIALVVVFDPVDHSMNSSTAPIASLAGTTMRWSSWTNGILPACKAWAALTRYVVRKVSPAM